MHTPGPWSEHGKGGCPCGMIFGPDGNVLIAIAQGPEYLNHAEGPDCVPSIEAQQGNARLIASAPDLLSALKDVLRIADRQTTEFDAARAAVAKVEGR